MARFSVLMLALAMGLAYAGAPALAQTDVLYRADQKPADWPANRWLTLIDSKWGALAKLQEKLSTLLVACGKPAIVADGKFGNGSFTALAAVAECKGWPKPPPRIITQDIWSRVFQEGADSLVTPTASTSVAQRAFGLTLAYESTDFDRFYWNFGTADQAAGTWGPFGATINYGGEVRAILGQVEEAKPDLMTQAFGAEADFIRTRFLPATKESVAVAAAREAFDDPVRRKAWVDAFKVLGQDPLVQQRFMAYALESPNWLKPGLHIVYALIPPAERTEVDYAFLLDLVTQTGGYQSKTAKSKIALEAAAATKGSALTSAERREVIGRTFAENLGNPVFKSDRLARNVVFYIDGLGADRISPEEISGWGKRGGRRASDYGLSDDRKFDPGL